MISRVEKVDVLGWTMSTTFTPFPITVSITTQHHTDYSVNSLNYAGGRSFSVSLVLVIFIPDTDESLTPGHCSWNTSLGLYIESIYELTRSNLPKFRAVCDVTQSDDFTLFVSQEDYNSTQPISFQLTVGHYVIQILIRHCKYI